MSDPIEEGLKEIGAKLLDPPTSVDELMRLLGHAEGLVSSVEQAPTKSMTEAISPLTRALGSDVLVKHSNVDVKVAVASCISEILRITAPRAPYDDNKLEDVFQLIVSTFEGLSDKSSRSYARRINTLHIMAGAESYVIMLDLELDALIMHMFQHFLATISTDLPVAVKSSMAKIMASVIDESEDSSLELLAPMVSSLRRGTPVSRAVTVRKFLNDVLCSSLASSSNP